jgi:SAM-dependent methyltransferase
VPRFVQRRNYANSFGFQWNKFAKAQLDSYSGHPISHERFFKTTGWERKEMKDKWVLDVGCGAGRFAEIALLTEANVVAVDYSSAVDACWNNLGLQHSNLNVVQADIYHLPFKPESFDFIYCLGVLQHTPDVRRAFMALPKYVKKGGKLAVDVYPKLFLNMFWPKYWLRPFTKQMPQKYLLRIIELMLKYFFPVSLAIGRIPILGRKLRHTIPVANYEGILPLSHTQLKEWAFLDTFDMLAPAYDQPQSFGTLAHWFDFAGLQNIEIFRAGVLIGRGIKGAETKHI